MNLLAVFVAAASLMGPKHTPLDPTPIPGFNGYIPVVQTSPPPLPPLPFPLIRTEAAELVGDNANRMIQVGSYNHVSDWVNYSLTVEVMGANGYETPAAGMVSATFGNGNGNPLSSGFQIDYRNDDCDSSVMANGRRVKLTLAKGHTYQVILHFSTCAGNNAPTKTDSDPLVLVIPAP